MSLPPYGIDETIIDDDQNGRWFLVYNQSEGFQPWAYAIKTHGESEAEEIWSEQPRNVDADTEQLVVREIKRSDHVPMKYVIEITTDNLDAESIVREATNKIACELDWGGEDTTTIQATKAEQAGTPLPLLLVEYNMGTGFGEA